MRAVPVRPVLRTALLAVVLAAGAACSSSVSGDGRLESAGAGAATSGRQPPPAWPAGVVHKEIPTRNHTTGRVNYPDSPPMGGDHNPEWADCTGTVYSAPVRNENAVHSLEHGAVWITYRPGLDTAGVAALRALVEGHDYTFMSPYPSLDHAVSAQSWGYQLKTDDPRDPRISRFITTYRRNEKTTPEPGASCINPSFPGA